MVEVLKKEYWSKSEAFLLPLTGLTKSQKYNMKSYLFWGEYSIENYQLIVSFSYKNYEEFLKYCKKIVFPILDRNGYLIESYDFEGQSVFVLDISEWALDVEMFLKGKYSKMSKDAKKLITEFHTFYDKGPKILIEISASLDPNDKYPILDDMTAIEYVAEYYKFDIKELKKIGELGSIYDKKNETLSLDIEESKTN